MQEEQYCSECNNDKFNVLKTKTTMKITCFKCGTEKVFFTEQWL